MKVQRYDLSAIKCNQALPSSNWIKGEDHDFIVSARDKLIDEMLETIDALIDFTEFPKGWKDGMNSYKARAEAMRKS